MTDASGQFEAFDESGVRYTVHIRRGVRREAGAAVGSIPEPGPDELRLGNGEVVTRHSQGLYSIARTGVRLTSTDRTAL
jgi:hypothetical protein